MAEHQIAWAYAERLTRAAQWQEAFDEARAWTADSLQGHGGDGTAWLIIAGRPTRPVPRSAPRLDRDAARAIVDNARRNPVTHYQSRVPVLHLLGAGASRIGVGLNAWVITNRVREGAQQMREVSVELHHDGSFVFVADLSQHTPPGDLSWPGTFGVVNADVVEQACVDLEALLLQLLRTERIDTPMRVQVSVASEADRPLKCAEHAYDDRYHFASGTPALPRLRPITVEVPAGATEQHTQPAAAELASGILNQFGLSCQSKRYTT
jgi:hypothetical protein